MLIFFNGGLSSQTTQRYPERASEVKSRVVVLSRVDNVQELPQRRIKSTEDARCGWMRNGGHITIPNPWIWLRRSRLATPGPPGRARSGDLVGRSGGLAD